MDLELIKHYAHELHWHLPEETQQESIAWLIENTPRDQLDLYSHVMQKAAGKMR